MQRSKVFSVLVSVLALALLPLATGSFGVDFVTKTMIYAIVALSLELLVGTTGLVCFGQAAFFGLAGYAAVKLSPEGAPASRAGTSSRADAGRSWAASAPRRRPET
jgi:branched-chain amino acid transport system permease protein